MKKRILLDMNKRDETTLVAKAIASPVRLDILKMLIRHSSNISDIAREFDLPLSTTANHIKVLEEAGLILTIEKPGLRGSQKICGIIFEDIYFNAFPADEAVSEDRHSYSMGVGQYFDVNVTAPCGLVTDKSYLGVEDSPSVFYFKERQNAQLAWFNSGYIEYRFPFNLNRYQATTRIVFSLELCSEAPGYNNNWPSDVAISIDGIECAVIHSTGDFGGVRGFYNPDWWPSPSTQYGMLHQIEINHSGCYLDSVKYSDVTLDQLCLKRPYISVRIEVKEDAENCGGVNIFGECFGNHPQALQLDFYTEPIKNDDQGIPLQN